MRYTKKVQTEEWERNPGRAKFVTYHAYKEGVFRMPQGKWIARVKRNHTFTTLSQHDTEEEAQQAYNDFYETKP